MSFNERENLEQPVRTFFRFFRFLLPYWDKALLMVLAILVISPLIQVEALVRRLVIDTVVMNSTEPIPRRVTLLFIYFGMVGGILWSGQILDRLRYFFGAYLSMFVTMDLRKMFYRHLHKLPYGFFQNRPIGEHMYRTMEDIRNDAFPHSRGLVDMVTVNVPVVFATLNEMFWQGMVVMALNPMALAFLAAIIVPHTLLSWWMNTLIKRAYLRLKYEEQEVPAILRDSIAGVETVKSYGQRRYLTLRYVRQLILAIRQNFRRDYLTLTMEQFVSWFLDIVMVSALWIYLVYEMMIGQISVGTFTVLLPLSFRFIGPFKTMVNHWMNIRQQLVPAQRVLETLDVEPAIQDLPDAHPMRRVEGRIRFENVSFAYDPAVPVLQDISFEVKAGGSIGIVGRSGAGKTTILNLLLRLHRPDSGRVLVDDYDLDKIRIADWQSQIGMVLQNTFIFGTDVAYNIRYGKTDATDEEIWKALEMAEADEFVASLPQRLYTDLAEGTKLSGGQKQRLGIARALVRHPQVLILDEPTSSLDSRTENEIWRSFERAMKGTTSIIVSHRLTTVRKADHILVLENGRIVEQGTHESLLREGGVYEQMWRDQTGGVA